MIRLLRRLYRDRRGVAALEFAIIGPAFFMLLLGGFNYGFAIIVEQQLVGAVQAAAACGGTGQCATSSAVQAYALARLSGLPPDMQPPDNEFVVNMSASCGVSVTAESVLYHLVNLFPTMNLSATACFPKTTGGA